MKLRPHFSHLTGLTLATFFLSTAYAQTAPVYDVDSMVQRESSQSSADASDEVSEGNAESGFVRVDNEAPASSSSASSSAIASNAQPNVAQRLQRLEEQMRISPNGEAIAHMESLQEQLQSLRGQVELLTHQLVELQIQQKNLYSDFDKRLEKNQPANSPAPTQGETITATEKAAQNDIQKPAIIKPSEATPITAADVQTKPNQPNMAEEQKIYQSAYNLIKQKKYNDAVVILRKMLNKYPSGQFASNAHYWLGELFGLMGKHEQALSEFNVIVKTYPQSPRISDAQLKVGLILASQLKWSDAKLALKKVISQYPGTSSAKMASEQLKQLKQAGH